MPLFRAEAMRGQDRLHGDVDLAPPTSWQVVGFGVAGSFAVAVAFLSVAHYARVAVASGVVESTLGTVQAATPVGGIVTRVDVTEGQRVRRGQVLAVIDHRTTTAGASLEERRAAAARNEVAASQQRATAMRRASEAHVQALDDEASGARADLASALAQSEEQRALVAAASEDLDKAKRIAAQGFVSQQDVRRREETLATRQQGMARLRQQAEAARATISRTASDVAQERASLAASLGQVEGERAQIAARASSLDASPVTTIVAPVSGTVAGIGVTPGATIGAGSSAMAVIPDGGRLRLRLAVPPDAAASVAAGQAARVAIDAFPYQTYGTIPARVDFVTPVAIATSSGPRFIAYATPERTDVRSYGQEKPIRPGMTATIRIRTLDRTLMQWLLDPIYAVARR